MTHAEPKVIHLEGLTEEERARELAELYEDPCLRSCMNAHLENTGDQRDPEKVKARRSEALRALSANPPDFWDMSNG